MKIVGPAAPPPAVVRRGVEGGPSSGTSRAERGEALPVRPGTPDEDTPRRIVVVGAGIAGLTAALRAHRAGLAVTLVVKGALGGGSTPLAQGGIAGAYGPGDSSVLHAADTLTAGAGLCSPEAVAALVAGAPAAIAGLAAAGVAFDRDEDGSIARGQEAAHGHPRIAHAGGDATGAAISVALVARVREAADAGALTIREHAFLTDLVVEGGRCTGIRMLVAGRTETLAADVVLLATGGAGQLFTHTTNPAGATGDGIAAALRAGVTTADLEFVQFHPTMLAVGAPFLISEAVRGEGAVLRGRASTTDRPLRGGAGAPGRSAGRRGVGTLLRSAGRSAGFRSRRRALDASGRRFAFDAHPDGELAPRDVVARAIARQAGIDGEPVRLDATELGARFLAARFPTIDRVVRERGLDWAREPIPVTPAQHYLMGGIATDIDGRTSLPGLFAIGEVARTGVHGANRLASNSLLEGAVFAARAVAALGSPPPSDPAARTGNRTTHAGLSPSAADAAPVALTAPAVTTPAPPPPPDPTARTGNRATYAGRARHVESVDAASSPSPAHRIPFSRAALQSLTWEHVGLLRTVDGLAEALMTIRGWLADRHPPATVAEHEDANLLLVADATASAALARPVSAGAHFIESPALGPVLIGAR